MAVVLLHHRLEFGFLRDDDVAHRHFAWNSCLLPAAVMMLMKFLPVVVKRMAVGPAVALRSHCQMSHVDR